MYRRWYLTKIWSMHYWTKFILSFEEIHAILYEEKVGKHTGGIYYE